MRVNLISGLLNLLWRRDGYRPERHYFRGSGPKSRQKLQPGGGAANGTGAGDAVPAANAALQRRKKSGAREVPS